MDPYDAILEQLKSAQQQAAETVASRLTSVLNSLETALAEARRAVDEAGAGGADQLFPTAAVEDAVEASRAQLNAVEERAGLLVARIEELESELARSQARPPASGGLSLATLRRLDAARSQSELLRELLPVLVEDGGRAAVLVVRDGGVSAWSGVGFSSEERLRGWQGRVEDSPALAAVTADGSPVRFRPAADPVLARWMESEVPSDLAVLVPVSLRGRMVGAIYADRPEDAAALDAEQVQAAVAVACWLIDTLGLRQTVPSAMLAPAEDLMGAAAEVEAEPADEAFGGAEPTPAAGVPALAPEPEPPDAEDMQPVPEPEPAAVGEPETTGAAAGEYAIADEYLPAEPEPEPEPEPTREVAPTEVGGYELDTGEESTAVHFDPSATMRLEPPRVEAEPEVESEPEPEPLESPAVEPASVHEVTPPPVRPVTPPPPAPAPPPPEDGRSPEEQAQHDEARRFARLLVSEIKLYNEDEVELGRRNADLYPRLKEDIDRSREMYEKRISESVRSHRDYFREELVRILADGDPDALGM